MLTGEFPASATRFSEADEHIPPASPILAQRSSSLTPSCTSSTLIMAMPLRRLGSPAQNSASQSLYPLKISDSRALSGTPYSSRPSLVENYRFGTGTCDFLICRRCGAGLRRSIRNSRPISLLHSFRRNQIGADQLPVLISTVHQARRFVWHFSP
jgi:hypothetical protein